MPSEEDDTTYSSENFSDTDLIRGHGEGVLLPPIAVARPIGPEEVQQQLDQINAAIEASSSSTTTQITNLDGSTTTVVRVTYPDGHMTTTTTTVTSPPVEGPVQPVQLVLSLPQEQPGTRSRNAPIITPLPLGEEPNPNQMRQRIHAFRIRAGLLAGLSEDIIIPRLRAVGWDLPAAIAQWRIDRNAARARDIANMPGRSPQQRVEDRLFGATSLHHNRRRAIDQAYRDHAMAAPLTARSATPLRIASTLRSAQWNMEAAGAALRDASAMSQLDRQMRRWRMPNPTGCHRDERLALLTDFTGTDDWVSVKALLDRYGYDLARAVEVWMQQGLSTKGPSPAQRRETYRVPLLRHDDAEDLWPGGRPISGPLVGIDTEDLRHATYDYGTGPYERRTGWLVGHDPAPAWPGIVVDEYKQYRTIRDGFMSVNEYDNLPTKEGTGKKAKGDKPATPAVYENFDWYNPHHVSQLNRFKGQPLRRTAAIIKKRATQPFHALEMQWLYDWHFDALMQVLGHRSVDEYRAGNGAWPIDFDLEELTKQFNGYFAGRTDLPDGNGEARNDRTSGSLDICRRRLRELCNDFGLKYYGKAEVEGDHENGEEQKDNTMDAVVDNGGKKNGGEKGPKRLHEDDESDDFAEPRTLGGQLRNRKKPKVKKSQQGEGGTKEEDNNQDDNDDVLDEAGFGGKGRGFSKDKKPRPR